MLCSNRAKCFGQNFQIIKIGFIFKDFFLGQQAWAVFGKCVLNKRPKMGKFLTKNYRVTDTNLTQCTVGKTFFIQISRNFPICFAQKGITQN